MDSATATQFDRLASVDCNAPRGFCFSHLCLWLLCLLFLLQSLTASEANGVAFQSLLLLKEFRAVESNLGSKLPSCLWHTASLPPAAPLMLHSVRPPPPTHVSPSVPPPLHSRSFWAGKDDGRWLWASKEGNSKGVFLSQGSLWIPRLFRCPGSSPLLWWASSGPPFRVPGGASADLSGHLCPAASLTWAMHSDQRPPSHRLLGLQWGTSSHTALPPLGPAGVSAPKAGPPSSCLQQPPLGPRDTLEGRLLAMLSSLTPSLELDSAFHLWTSPATRQAPVSVPRYTLSDWFTVVHVGEHLTRK